MSEWKEAVDPNSGRTYYANVRTKVTTWVMPEELKKLKAARAAAQQQQEEPPPPPPPPVVVKPPSAPKAAPVDEWKESKDHLGRTYYYNKRTGTSTWQKPAGYEPKPTSAPPPPPPPQPQQPAAPQAASTGAAGLPPLSSLPPLGSSSSSSSRAAPAAAAASPAPDFSAKISKLQAAIDKLEMQLDTEKHRFKVLESNLESVTQERDKLLEKQRQVDHSAGDLSAQLSTAQSDLAEANKNLKLAELDVVKVKDDLVREKQKAVKAEEEKKKLKADADAAAATARDADGKVAKLATELKEAMERQTQSYERTRQLEDQNRQLESDKQALNAKLSDSERQIQTLKDQVDRLNANATSVSASTKDAQEKQYLEKLKALEDKLQAAEDKVRKTETEKKALQEKLDKAPAAAASAAAGAGAAGGALGLGARTLSPTHTAAGTSSGHGEKLSALPPLAGLGLASANAGSSGPGSPGAGAGAGGAGSPRVASSLQSRINLLANTGPMASASRSGGTLSSSQSAQLTAQAAEPKPSSDIHSKAAALAGLLGGGATRQTSSPSADASSPAAAAAASVAAAAASSPLPSSVSTGPKVLPAPWVEYQDPTSGLPYFHNPSTNETSWTFPVGTPADAAPKVADTITSTTPATASPSGVAAHSTSPSSTPSAAASTAAASASSAATAAAAAAAGPAPPSFESSKVHEEWQELFDPVSKNRYFYNKTTRITTWDPPDGWGDDTPAPPPQKDPLSPRTSAASVSQMPSSLNLSHTRTFTASSISSESGMGGAPAAFAGNLGDIREDSPSISSNSASRSAVTSSYQPSSSAAAGGSASTNGVINPHPQKEAALEPLPVDQVDRYSFAHFAEKYFNAQKKGMFGSQSVEERIQHTPKLIKASLTKLSPPYDEDALQTFRNITSYMGERKSSKAPGGHVKKLAKMGIKADNEEFRDEIYCQIMKQISNNPDRGCNLRGWKLLALLLGVFPPSKRFHNYLKAFLQKARDYRGDPEVPGFAMYCEEQLYRTSSNGARETVPSSGEMECVESRKPIPVMVYFSDGSYRTVSGQPQTTIYDLTLAMIRTYELPHRANASPEDFMWAVHEEDLETGNVRALPFGKRVMDVREQWTDRVTERRSSVAVPPAGNPNFTIRLLFRARLFFSKDMALASLSAGGLHLLYIQAVHDVVHGDYACPPKEAVSLCALQVQAEHEDAKIEYADILSDNLLKLHFSKQMVHQYKGSETHLRQLVGQEREKLRGVTRAQAKHKYLELVHTIPVYGCSFYQAQEVTAREVSDCVVGISERGVFSLHPVTRQTTRKPITIPEVTHFVGKEDNFEISAGDKKFGFKSRFAPHMEKTLSIYAREARTHQ